MLDVGDGHRVYWETAGRPDGRPALWLHGRPGAPAGPNRRRYCRRLLAGPPTSSCPGTGLLEVGSGGGVGVFGDARYFGPMAGKPLYNPIVGIASTPFVSGLGASPARLGYLEVVADGGILTFGDASSSSSVPGGQALAAGVVGAPGVGGTFSGQQP